MLCTCLRSVTVRSFLQGPTSAHPAIIMATSTSQLDTQHEDMIHDCQFDFYGNKLATCSSDRTIKIFDLIGESQQLVATLKGHEGPVWQIAWAHPRFGVVLASCSYDRKIIVWKETSPNEFTPIYEHRAHELSINSIAWSPQEFGLSLACGSSDGYISVITHRGDNTWEEKKFQAHQIGVNAVSWAPAVPVGSLLTSPTSSTQLIRRLVSGGCDNVVKIWSFNEQQNEWKLDEMLEGDPSCRHNDWIRDVAWAPNIGLPTTSIASCSQDGIVIIWTKEETSNTWSTKQLPKFPEVVWRVSWSVTGNILAVSGGDNKVTLWKESLSGDGEWIKVSELDETGAMTYGDAKTE